MRRKRRRKRKRTGLDKLCACFDPIWANNFPRADCNIKWTSNMVLTIGLSVVIITILTLSATYLQVNDLNEVHSVHLLLLLVLVISISN